MVCLHYYMVWWPHTWSHGDMIFKIANKNRILLWLPSVGNLSSHLPIVDSDGSMISANILDRCCWPCSHCSWHTVDHIKTWQNMQRWCGVVLHTYLLFWWFGRTGDDTLGGGSIIHLWWMMWNRYYLVMITWPWCRSWAITGTTEWMCYIVWR